MFADLLWPGRRSFSSLSEKEILALAISAEEDDERIYLDFADYLREKYPDSAKIFGKMAEQETLHRKRLTQIFRKRFGDHIPLLRREYIRDFYKRPPEKLAQMRGLAYIRAQAVEMEAIAARFYRAAAKRTSDAETRDLLNDLALEEDRHEQTAEELEKRYAPQSVRDKEAAQERRQTLLTWIQPGLAGLMDGSVSTLAPVFAAAFATHDPRQTFLIGLSASLGAGISMGFTEAAHDDGKLTGRGSPLKRGIANGLMTATGGLGHTLPYLIPDFTIATTLAFAIVFLELWVIAYVQHRFMDTPFWRASLQVVIGGALVFATGVLIGQA